MPIHTHSPQRALLPKTIDVLPMSRAIEKLAKLKEKGVDVPDEPLTMQSDQIDTLENVFQARTGKLVEIHVGELVAAIKAQGTTEPLLLWRCGAHPILLDGHHRLEAYRRAEREKGRRINIPVTWFKGSVEEAAVTAAKLNTRPKLGMTRTETSDHAWKLVLSERFTVNQIVTAASVSPRTVKYMREAKGKLGRNPERFSTWARARNAWKATGADYGDEEERDELEERAKVYADRMAKAFTTILARNPTLAAKAFDIYCGQRATEVIQAWMDLLGADFVDDEDDEEEAKE